MSTTKDTKDTKGTEDKGTKAGIPKAANPWPGPQPTPDRPFLKPNATSYRVIGCAMRVHSNCGPGGLERAIAAALHHEMRESGLYVEDEVTMPLRYGRLQLPEVYRADFIVEKCLVVEVKCVEHVLEVHRAQVLNYLRQSGLMLGVLLNFKVAHMREGLHRIINGPEDEL